MKYPVAILVVLLCLLLAACGSDTGEPETPPATTVFIPATLPPGTVTVGDLLDRLDAAWINVSSLRTTFWTTSDGTIDAPPPEGQVTIEVVVLPADRHVTQLVNGNITDEQRIVDGRIFMRGALVPAAVAPLVDANTWIEIDPAAATSTLPIAQHVAYLTSPVEPGIGVVSPETRLLAVTPAGDVTIQGRACTRFTFGDPDGISYELALDKDDLPCRLVVSGGESANVTVYEVNPDGVTIVSPEIPTPTPAS